MRKTAAVLVAVLLAASLALGGPGVPLAGVEANRVPAPHKFGDGPTPIKHPWPGPVPDGYVTAAQLTSLFAEGATWWTYTGEALTWHRCPGPVETRLAAHPAEVRDLVHSLAETSPEIAAAIEPFRLSYGDEVTAANGARLDENRDLVPIEVVNALWLARVATHEDEIASSIETIAAPLEAPTCTSGPCNCSECPAGHECDCQLYVEGSDDCSILMRDACNVDVLPTPKRARGPLMDLGR